MTPSQRDDWQYLAEQATNEMDPDNLVSLATQLNRVLGEQGGKIAGTAASRK